MRIYIKAPAEYYVKTIEDLLRIFFPRVELVFLESDFTKSDTSDCPINFSTAEKERADSGQTFEDSLLDEAVLSFREEEANFQGKPVTWTVEACLQFNEKRALARKQLPESFIPEEELNLRRRLIRRATLCVLEEVTGIKAGPWGILTGLRPTKIVHRLLDQGWNTKQAIKELVQQYALDSGKARLLVEIAQRQRPFLLSQKEVRQLVSIYVGIPFCPTRCLYCSFPGYALPRSGNLVELFLQALMKEIQAVGAALRERGIQVQSIYIGGGTPTSISAGQLEILLSSLRENIPLFFAAPGRGEFSVEGGRPDTLDLEKLRIIKAAGVNRLCINPQTMQDRTLKLIGRKHLTADTLQAYAWARQVGIECINMDVILGLPGESVQDVRASLDMISHLQPENLSVHTLAIKRASRLKQEREQWSLPAAEEVEKMLEISQEATADLGMHPYYLYRQKYILANLENIGYARPGWESIYNIQVMEERQTIIGLGGGAGSKWVNPADWTLVNTYNPRDPQNYTERIQEIIQKKIERIKGFSAVFVE